MKFIHLVRHGETIGNTTQNVQGEDDTLTLTGEKQAIQVAERLSALSFENLLVSDYVRTRQTVVPLLKLTKVEPEYSPLFREVRRPSVFENESNQNVVYKQFLDEMVRNYSDKNWHHSDEENFYDLLSRADLAKEKLLSMDGDTVVVSHGMFIRFLVLRLLLNRQFQPEIWATLQYNLLTTNTGITTLRFKEEEDRWSLVTFNDFAHFAE